MEKRTLGNTGITVSPLCFGGNVFGWTIDEQQSFEILDAFTAAGLNFIDTADVYSRWKPGNQGGESETIIGNWLKRSGKRESVVIATKVGMEMAPGKQGLSKGYIVKAVEDSLRRLQTDYIDLYQSHKDDENTPIEETLETFARLIEQGKVRAIGASNYTADRLKQNLSVSDTRDLPGYETLQPLYNLMERQAFEQDLEPLCLERNISVISYFSLASGFLTGKYRSEEDLNKSQRGQGVKKYLNDKGNAVLRALDEVAAEYGANPAQVALAWLIARPGITAPIASATSVEQLQDLVKATELKLSGEAIIKLNQASEWR
jgi:aryl-alcohol dehydrogenase-like predicted oxidoreductase